MADVFIGLGSNLGDRPRFLRQALQALQSPQIRLRQCSGFRRTAPVGGPEQPDFVNAVARLEVQTTPKALMHRLLQTEARFGRRRQEVNGPRTLDLDLLVFGQHQDQTEFLTLPHPRATKRRFVLEPLIEIAPRLALNGKSAWDHLQTLPASC
jgi:2-amino-4-hydroxy-6-hydroxymethyldihydropteridine diphosphokinase